MHFPDWHAAGAPVGHGVTPTTTITPVSVQLKKPVVGVVTMAMEDHWTNNSDKNVHLKLQLHEYPMTQLRSDQHTSGVYHNLSDQTQNSVCLHACAFVCVRLFPCEVGRLNMRCSVSSTRLWRKRSGKLVSHGQKHTKVQNRAHTRTHTARLAYCVHVCVS